MNGHHLNKTHGDPQPRWEGKLPSAPPPTPTLKFRSGPPCQGSQSHGTHPGKAGVSFHDHLFCSPSRNPLRAQVETQGSQS